MSQTAYYFGCIGEAGHFFHSLDGSRTTYNLPPGIPWTIAHMDGGLLKNGRVPDKYNGDVRWACGGRDNLWFAFVWWDNSVDGRGASNSGFYVSGFETGQAQAAFKYACDQFPQVVSRQRVPLTLFMD